MYEPLVCSSAAKCWTGVFAMSSAVIGFLRGIETYTFSVYGFPGYGSTGEL